MLVSKAEMLGKKWDRISVKVIRQLGSEIFLELKEVHFFFQEQRRLNQDILRSIQREWVHLKGRSEPWKGSDKELIM